MSVTPGTLLIKQQFDHYGHTIRQSAICIKDVYFCDKTQSSTIVFRQRKIWREC